MNDLGMKWGAILTAIGVLVAAFVSMLTAPNIWAGLGYELAGAISV